MWMRAFAFAASLLVQGCAWIHGDCYMTITATMRDARCRGPGFVIWWRGWEADVQIGNAVDISKTRDAYEWP